jgi:preprotein translocase subunit SecE
MFRRLIDFFKGVIDEMRKVSWPSKEEVIASSAVTIVFILILSLILGLVDFIASTLIGLLLR